MLQHGRHLLRALACMLCFCSSLAHAEGWPDVDWKKAWINPGFYTYHFEKDQQLDNVNAGLGVEVPINATYSFTLGRFHNSDHAKSNYVGMYVLPYRFGNAKIGAVVGAFNGYPNAYDGGWFPALIPVMAFEGQHLGLNVAFVPTIANKLHGGISFQVKYRFGS